MRSRTFACPPPTPLSKGGSPEGARLGSRREGDTCAARGDPMLTATGEVGGREGGGQGGRGRGRREVREGGRERALPTAPHSKGGKEEEVRDGGRPPPYRVGGREGASEGGRQGRSGGGEGARSE